VTTNTSPSIPTYDATLTRIEDLTPRVKCIHFDLPPGQKIDFKAGQYAQILIPTPDKVRRTSYSIASPPQQATSLEFCVTAVQQGVASPFLAYFVEGARLQICGPMGRFTAPENLPRDTVFIAAGSGISPFRSIILDQLKRNTPRRIVLIFGNRFEQDIIYRREWEILAKEHPNFRFEFVLSQPLAGWTGRRGYVQDALPEVVDDLRSKDFYVCGLRNMITAVVDRLQSLGVPKDQIFYERYD
jgi:CDP-4-dehydro-6-deoxyglucose reductase, E3